uniref:Uncharacterized protein n=1 Tax=Leersia perrieri TaxID=77586 RepID=A0A0D9W8E0_9ORYZ
MGAEASTKFGACYAIDTKILIGLRQTCAMEMDEESGSRKRYLPTSPFELYPSLVDEAWARG